MSERERVRSFTLIVPGPWESAADLVAVLQGAELAATEPSDAPFAADAIEVSVVPMSPSARARVAEGLRLPTGDSVHEELAHAPAFAVVELGWGLEEHLARSLALGRALVAAGGVAASFVFSGTSATWAQWDEAFSRHAVAVMRLAVAFVVDEGEAFSAGMHHFDLPDAQVLGLASEVASRWIFGLCAHQLVEGHALVSGQGFALSADEGRRVLERWPDALHHRSDERSNPFGVWRLVEHSEVVPPGEDLAVAVPALLAMLAAAEQRAGAPLTRGQVEAIAARTPRVMTPVAEARTMERSRGYADLLPELAWEQWLLERSMG